MSNKRHPQELRDRAVRLVPETRDQYPSLNQATHSIGAKLGVGPESLRSRMRQADIDAGAKSGTRGHAHPGRVRTPRPEPQNPSLEPSMPIPRIMGGLCICQAVRV